MVETVSGPSRMILLECGLSFACCSTTLMSASNDAFDRTSICCRSRLQIRRHGLIHPLAISLYVKCAVSRSLYDCGRNRCEANSILYHCRETPQNRISLSYSGCPSSSLCLLLHPR
eukprot:scaffold16211_cov54-Cylindrotheca_fusiformis.AAC.1